MALNYRTERVGGKCSCCVSLPPRTSLEGIGREQRALMGSNRGRAPWRPRRARARGDLALFMCWPDSSCFLHGHAVDPQRAHRRAPHL